MSAQVVDVVLSQTPVLRDTPAFTTLRFSFRDAYYLLLCINDSAEISFENVMNFGLYLDETTCVPFLSPFAFDKVFSTTLYVFIIMTNSHEGLLAKCRLTK